MIAPFSCGCPFSCHARLFPKGKTHEFIRLETTITGRICRFGATFGHFSGCSGSFACLVVIISAVVLTLGKESKQKTLEELEEAYDN